MTTPTPPIPVDDARIIVAEIDAVAAAMAHCYDALPPIARANATQLGHSLGVMRKRLVGTRERKK